MRITTLLIVITSLMCSFPVIAAERGTVANIFTVLSYHDVLDDVRDYPDPYAVDSSALVKQFAWLRGNGYTPVSLDDIITAHQGGKTLPAKAVLLTFDDAYLSFYTRVYPLLREFRFPAVLAVVGKWIDEPQDVSVMYGEQATVSVASFPTWDQIREMTNSGLVEIASHSYDLHRGVLANPQGNLQAAATARIYNPTAGTYENDASWRTRVHADLARNSQVIEQETGQRPRVIVWPYGSYNNELVDMADKLGMPIALTLEDSVNTSDIPLEELQRTLIKHNPVLADFTHEVRGPLYPEPVRVIQINLDQIYNLDPVVQENNLSKLLDRIMALIPSHIYLQATADLNGDGIADAAYFPTRHLPLRDDLFNRVAWQIATRNDVKVYAVLPVTEFHLPTNSIAEVYEDLARHAPFDGLVFDDHVLHDEVENTGALEFTQQLAMRTRAFRAPLKTVRTMTIDENSKQNAQKFSAYIAAYDYVALTGIPIHENITHPDTWLSALAANLGRMPNDPFLWHKVVFMLHNTGRYPDNNMDIHTGTGELLARQMRGFQLGNALNFGYSGDDFINDDPPLVQIAPVISKRIHPR